MEAVLRELAGVVDGSGGDGPALSLGVVSPFRDQVDAILERVSRALPSATIDRHAIVIGTAHSLQGDEKDLVILSTSIDPGFHSASLRFLENPNLFNVAITRARRQLIVVTSVRPDDLPAGLLREFLRYAQGCMQPHQPAERYDHEFEKELAGALREEQIELWPKLPAAGLCIDLVASREERHLAILCDAPARPEDDAEDPLTHQRILTRAGWPLARIPQRSWLADRVACVQHVVRHLPA